MLTIFTTPKAFKGLFAIIQENAIASWTKLRPKCQIILIGDDFGTAKIAKKYGLKHVGGVATNKFGTPLLPDIFKKGYENAKFEKLAYVNSDIILTSDFTKAIKQIDIPTFFLTGSRWEFSVKKKLDFQVNWQEKLKKIVLKKGSKKKKGPTDYFVFTPKINLQIPQFALGRTYWDAWLIFKAKQLKIPVIDATGIIWAVHQSHDYSHAGGWDKVWLGAEAKKNKKLIGDKRKYFNALDADYILTKDGIKRPSITFARIIQKIEKTPVLNPKIAPFFYPLNFIIRVGRFIRDKKRRFLI